MTPKTVAIVTIALQMISAFCGRADVGANNPTGVAGVFNPDVTTTGGSYSPYTACAFRQVTDVVVPGAVGMYPLAFTRTMTSRYTAGLSTSFGGAGSWIHSYQWSIDAVSFPTNSANTLPSVYTVNYPDGRRVVFSTGRNGDPYFEGPIGVRDRLERGLNYCYLHLPDGGQIKFAAYHNYEIETHSADWWFGFSAIIDPNGQTTTVSYPADHSMTITEPAGRILKIFHKIGPTGGTVVDRVESWATSTVRTQTVTYGYTSYPASGMNYSSLTSVTYPDQTVARYTYQNSNIAANGRPLIRTCIDPMYGGPMWRIAYSFVPAPSGVYGQLQSEKYFDGTNIGAAVSTLTVTGTNTRTETRGDGPNRLFTYNGYKLYSVTDFKPVSPRVTTYMTYDAAGFVNAVQSFNGYTTNYVNDPWTGNVTETTYPLTASDTALSLGRATTSVVYNSGNNPYYASGYTNGEMPGGNKRGFSPTYTRDTNNRITRIDYPDGGYETFTDYNAFGQFQTHRLKTGGTETFTYNSRGLLTAYRDPYHPSTPVATVTYTYYTSAAQGPVTWIDRIRTIKDGRGYITTYTYNNRGQVATVAPPGVAHPVTPSYNSNGNGTLVSLTNELQKTTTYEYDNYKRLISVTLPPLNGGPSPAPTTVFYDHNGGTAADYTHTASAAARVTSPTSKIVQTVFDENFRKTSVTVGSGTSDAATSSYTYDNNGNVRTVRDPNHPTGVYTQYFYDQQNRLAYVDDMMLNDATTPHKNSDNHTVSWKYDQSSNVLTIRRANNQLTTNVYDSMNHLTQSTRTQTPSPNAVTQYSYYTPADGASAAVGLLKTMKDPRSVALGNNGGNYTYSYLYDLMGRKTRLTYPNAKTEQWNYDDDAGNLHTFTNRDGKVQTFSYDSRERLTGFSWNDTNPTTPAVTYGYDDASRLTSITNVNATITRLYWDDDTLRSETSRYADATDRTVSYTYNPDLTRASIHYPSSYTTQYTYTGRNQLNTIHISIDNMIYGYDLNGNLQTRTLYNGTTSSYAYNAMDRVTSITHSLNGVTKTFGYGYNSTNDEKYVQRNGASGDVFAYDLADEVTGVSYEVANPTTATAATNITYDANGNRSAAFGLSYTIGSSNLNQYSQRSGVNATYDNNGNMLNNFGQGSYTFDAQNRVTSATKSGVSRAYAYDGLNRMISSTTSGTPTYYVYDGWDLIQEYQSFARTGEYYYGPEGVAFAWTSQFSPKNWRYYYQDAQGSTTAIGDLSGHLLEWYRYDLQGTPYVNGVTTNQTSAYGLRHLFTGQQWDSGLRLYDLRNRFYSPDIGRFIQPDPIGFGGDASNLYRYCDNNPANEDDPNGLGNKLDGSVSDGTQKYTPTGSHIPVRNGFYLFSAFNFPQGFSSTNGWGSVSGPASRPNPGRILWPSNRNDSLTMGQVTQTEPSQTPAQPSSSPNSTSKGGFWQWLNRVVTSFEHFVDNIFGTTPIQYWTPNVGMANPNSPNWRPPTNAPQAPPDPATLPPGYTVRVRPPEPGYPNGYWRIERPMPQGGAQGIDPRTMRPGPQWDTHVPLPPPG